MFRWHRRSRNVHLGGPILAVLVRDQLLLLLLAGTDLRSLYKCVSVASCNRACSLLTLPRSLVGSLAMIMNQLYTDLPLPVPTSSAFFSYINI